MKLSSILTRIVATTLSLVLFTTNSLLAHAPETNFWAERRKSTQRSGDRVQEYAFLNSNFQAPDKFLVR